MNKLTQIGESKLWLIDEDSDNPHRLIIWRKRDDGTKVFACEVSISAGECKPIMPSVMLTSK